MKLKPCPFCGTTSPLVGVWPPPPPAAPFVRCGKCGTNGPPATVMMAAMNAWNRRAKVNYK